MLIICKHWELKALKMKAPTPQSGAHKSGRPQSDPTYSSGDYVSILLTVEQCYELETAVSELIRLGNSNIATGRYDYPILKALMRRRDLLEDIRLRIHQAI